MQRKKTEREQTKSMSQLFKTILCPIDFDDSSAAALDVASALASQNQAMLHALHVVFVPASSLGYPAEPYDRLGREEHKRLEQMIRAHVPGHITCRATTKIGSPVEEIISEAENLDADLIVMGTHGRGGVPRLLLGSVAECVMRGSGRAVLTVRPRSLAPEVALLKRTR